MQKKNLINEPLLSLGIKKGTYSISNFNYFVKNHLYYKKSYINLNAIKPLDIIEYILLSKGNATYLMSTKCKNRDPDNKPTINAIFFGKRGLDLIKTFDTQSCLSSFNFLLF